MARELRWSEGVNCPECNSKKVTKRGFHSNQALVDEVYITAGHKGHPAIVASENRKGRRRKLRGKRGRGTLAEEKPPVLGMIQRNGEVVIQMLPNVQQVTIQPLMTKAIGAGSMVYTDEYNIYDRLEQWGYQHKSVNHSAGEYARDEDGGGFHEVHVNAIIV